MVSIALFTLPLLLAAAAALTRSPERRTLWVPIGGFAARSRGRRVFGEHGLAQSFAQLVDGAKIS